MIFGNIGESDSVKYSLNGKDFIKIFRLFLVCSAGFAITFFAGIIPQINFGWSTPLIAALAPTVIEALRRFLTNYSAESLF